MASSNYCKDLLFRVRVENKMEHNIKFQLDFETTEQLNLIYPSGGICDYLKGKESSDVLTIRKRDARREDNPEDEAEKALIHKLAIELQWEKWDDSDFEMGKFASEADAAISKD